MFGDLLTEYCLIIWQSKRKYFLKRQRGSESSMSDLISLNTCLEWDPAPSNLMLFSWARNLTLIAQYWLVSCRVNHDLRIASSTIKLNWLIKKVYTIQHITATNRSYVAFFLWLYHLLVYLTICHMGKHDVSLTSLYPPPWRWPFPQRYRPHDLYHHDSGLAGSNLSGQQYQTQTCPSKGERHWYKYA